MILLKHDVNKCEKVLVNLNDGRITQIKEICELCKHSFSYEKPEFLNKLSMLHILQMKIAHKNTLPEKKLVKNLQIHASLAIITK